MKAQGIVEQTSEKPTRTGKTMFGIKVAGTWYSGFDAFDAKEGDQVEIDYKENGQYKNLNKNGVRVLGKASGGAKPAVGNSYATRDVSIGYQSSRKDAIATVQFMLDNDVVALPAKKADKMDAVIALIEDVTAKYYLKLQDVIEAGGVEKPEEVEEEGFIEDDVTFE